MVKTSLTLRLRPRYPARVGVACLARRTGVIRGTGRTSPIPATGYDEGSR